MKSWAGEFKSKAIPFKLVDLMSLFDTFAPNFAIVTPKPEEN
jgi:hypothetical protein